MNRLLLLSDLWGKRRWDWMHHYASRLEDHFDVVPYDCCTLAEIDLSDYSEASIHHQFTHGGIERAVKALRDKEKGTVHVLGFSIGGLIAWKAILDGLRAESLTALSSTRLRYEDRRPACTIRLLFAEHDTYRPTDDWFSKHNLDMHIHKQADHGFYSTEEMATHVSALLIDQLKPSC